jgi:hypothetical protein
MQIEVCRAALHFIGEMKRSQAAKRPLQFPAQFATFLAG